jgi:hypothetical protein
VGVTLSGVDLQRQTLRLYGELVCRRERWAGKLVFASGEGVSVSGLAAAVSIAGGTSLVVDPDGAAVKRVFRNGGVDFVVNSLDEALRILKNEIRKGTPVGVAVVADIGAVVAEMQERGVVADLEWGGIVEPSEALVRWLAERGWVETSLLTTGTAAEEPLLAMLSPEDIVRRRWLTQIKRYQRNAAGTRLLWMTISEQIAFAGLPPKQPLILDDV